MKRTEQIHKKSTISFHIRTSFKKMMDTIMVWQKAKARQMSALAFDRIGLSAPDELFPMLTCQKERKKRNGVRNINFRTNEKSTTMKNDGYSTNYSSSRTK